MKSKTVEECEHEWEKTTLPIAADNPKYKGREATITYLVCTKCKLKRATDMELKK